MTRSVGAAGHRLVSLVGGAILVVLTLPLATGCETILGEATLGDPAAGEACAKLDRCAPDADCKEVEFDVVTTRMICLPRCGAKADPACPADFTCWDPSSYSSQKHCYPSALVPTYEVGDYCSADYNDPCPNGSRCAERPSDYYTGGDVSTYCLVPCSGLSDSCDTGSCEEGKDGFFCE